MADNGARTDLTPAQHRAVAALLSERDTRSAARAAKVGERTLTRWLTLPAFRAALLDAESQAIDQATRQLISLQESAIGTLAEVLGSRVPPAVKLRAAQLVLDYLVKLRDLRNTEQRLQELESIVFSGDNRTPPGYSGGKGFTDD